jgi:hypothetical protein
MPACLRAWEHVWQGKPKSTSLCFVSQNLLLFYLLCGVRVGVLVDVWQGERDAFEHQLWVSSAMDTLLSSVKVGRDEVQSRNRV